MSGIYASPGSNFGILVKLQRYPRNIQYISVVEPDLKFGRLP